MTRLMGTTLLALTLGLGTPALAQDAQLQQSADRFLTQHGYTEVDATVLTAEQLARLQAVEESNAPDAEIRQRIDEVLVMDAGSAMFVSEEMRVMMTDPDSQNELRLNARALLTEAGYDADLADTLSIEQLAQIWFLQEGDQPANQPDELANRLQAILGQS